MKNSSRSFEQTIESVIFASRWILAPFFIGLIIAMFVLLLILVVLTLIDLSLAGNLLLIVLFSGYENFVSKLSIGDHEDRPSWMGKVSFSDLKMKVIGAIVAISAVELLKAFLVSTTLTGEQIGWKIAIHLTFVVSGLLFAASDWISDSRKNL